MDLVKNHTTIRKFKKKEIDSTLLNEIIEVACRASTTGNMQLYSIIINKDSAIKEKLTPLHFNQDVAKKAPVLITICADFNRFVKWCNARNAKHGYNNFLSFLTAAIDALLVAQNICIEAEYKGLGICYLGTTTYNSKEIIELLKLPKLVFPITTIALGWPDEKPKQVDRLPLESIIHDEYYKDYTKESIDALYSYKENLEESRKFIAENAKENLAQVYTDIRYKKSDNEYFSEKILDVLKDQGFLS